jgi:hypothetical protein
MTRISIILPSLLRMGNFLSHPAHCAPAPIGYNHATSRRRAAPGR